MLTTAHVKPFVVAILLHRGAVRPQEVLASLTPHCRADDLKVGGWDPLDNDYCEGTRAEKLVDEVLGEFVAQGITRYNERQDLWVLTSKHLPQIISWVTALGGRMPQHVLSEMSRQQVLSLTRQQEAVLLAVDEDQWDGTDIEPSHPRNIASNRTSDVDDCYAGSYREGDHFS